MEDIFAFLALLGIFAVPLIVIPHRLFPFTTSKSFFFMGLVEAMLVFWVYLLAVNNRYRLSKKQLLVFTVPLLLLVWLSVSAAFSQNPNTAFWSSFLRGTGLIFLYHCFFFGLMVASLARKEGVGFLKKVLTAFFLSGVVLALSTFFPEVLGQAARRGGLTGNSSYTGAYLVFAFFAGSILFFSAQYWRTKLWYLLGSILFVSVLFMIGARAAAASVFIGSIFACFLWLALSLNKKKKIIGFSLIAISIISVLVLGILVLIPSSRLHQKFSTAVHGGRLIFWHTAYQGIQERPLFGWGLDNFNIVFSKYFDPKILEPGITNEPDIDRPHNVVLEFFVAGGVPGGLLYLLFLSLFLYLPYLLFKKDRFSKGELSLFVGMFFAYFLQDMVVFDTPTTYVALFAFYGVLAGQLPVVLDPKKLPRDLREQSTFIASACFIILIPAYIFFVHQPAHKARKMLGVLGNDPSTLTAISSMGNGSDVGYIVDFKYKDVKSKMKELQTDPVKASRVHEQTLELLQQVDLVADTATYNHRLWLACANLMNADISISGDYSEETIARALSYTDRAVALAPADPRGYWIYGQLFTYTREFEKAKEYFTKAYELNPNISASSAYLAEFKRITGSQ